MNKRLTQLDKTLLCQQFALIIESEMSLSEGISLIAKKNDNPIIIDLLTKIREQLKQGYTIAEAFKTEEKTLGSYFTNMIRIGEKSGNLQQVFEQMALIFDRQALVNRKIKTAITYPIILATFMVAVILLILIKVLPLFDDILANVGGEMPALTKGLMSIGQFFSGYGLIVLAIIVIIGICLYFWMKTNKGKAFKDQLILAIPFLGKIVQYAFGASFARNMSMLIHSGITLPVALELLVETEDNDYFKTALKKAVAKAKDGQSLDLIIEELGVFPWLLLKLVAVAEVSGHLDKVLLKAAISLEQETEIKLQRVLSIIEPLLVTVLSICIGIILVSVVLPVFTILNQI